MMRAVLDRAGGRKGPHPDEPVKRSGRTLSILSIDVGGTRTRAVMAAVVGGKILLEWQVETPLAGKAALGHFIREILHDAAPVRCAVAFAGPLRDRSEAQMTNWPGRPVIRLRDLTAWGLAAGHTLILNDLESAACGVLALKDGGFSTPPVRTLHRPRGMTAPGSGNRVLLAPGTGLGTASIIGEVPLPSEVQHAAASPLDDRHAALIARYAREEGRLPSWEEFASGRGLVRTYRTLRSLEGLRPAGGVLAESPEDPAGAVAQAVARDPIACEALDYYYGCAGRAAQILALAVQPTGGITLCGSTTARNAAFIPKSRFLREIQSNAAQSALLRRFPVFVVNADLNLWGGLWACLHLERFTLPGFHNP